MAGPLYTQVFLGSVWDRPIVQICFVLESVYKILPVF